MTTYRIEFIRHLDNMKFVFEIEAADFITAETIALRNAYDYLKEGSLIYYPTS